MRYFEDYALGEIERFGRYEVTRDEMIAFASKYDPQPFHLDDAEASKSPIFKAMSASGWHTAAMAMAMQVAALEAAEPAFVAGLGVDELRWLAPVYAGDVLSSEREVVELRASKSRPQMGMLRLRTTVSNQDGDAVMRFTAIVLANRRPARP